MHIDNKLDTLLRIDALHAPGATLEQRIAALSDVNWQIQQAALDAIAAYPDPAAVDAIVKVFDAQDKLEIYGCSYDGELEDAPDEPTRQIWRMRFRVKHAGVLALWAIASKYGSAAITPAALTRLCHYASSQGEDYPVRAAACRTLGQCPGDEALAALKIALEDTEWCTAREALKSYALLTAS